MTKVDGQERWAVFSYKYCMVAVKNVGYVLEDSGLRFMPKFVTPLICVYCP